ncbi:hypothetical protein IJ732_03680, partial [bacterium]|nr:hypothetical protein [bacterium]
TYHKLFDGLINNCTAYDNGECSQCENGYRNNGTSCRDIRENTCDTYSGTTCTKCTSENLLVDEDCISMTSLHCKASDDGKTCKTCNDYYMSNNGACETGNITGCKSYDGTTCDVCENSYTKYENNNCYKTATVPEKCSTITSSGCILNDGTQLTKMTVGTEEIYVSETLDNNHGKGTFEVDGQTFPDLWAGAVEDCEAKGMTLPSSDTLVKMAQENKLPIYDGNSLHSELWSSDGWVVYDYKDNTVHGTGGACANCAKFICVAQ